MTIKKLSEKPVGKIEIDLTGPDGNAHALMGIADRINNLLGKPYDIEEVFTEMKSSDYDNLVDVMDKYFGDYIIMYR